MLPRRDIGRSALFAVFTLSGFSGLIYESIWSHYLKLFLGHAAYAQTLVLSVFMGGMALGAWLVARFSPRLRNLLLAYALVEGVTGILALAFHPAYLAIVAATFDTLIPSLHSLTLVNPLKWGIAALLILPQSILLGSTFPLISGGMMRRYPDSPGASLAMLYFTNSLGAACGVLVSGFWLIGAVGLPGTVMTAGLINVALALVVWWIQRGETTAPAMPPVPRAHSGDRGFARRILLAAMLAGAAAFIYEITWIRMLSLVLGSSTHAFELMLSAFIFGLAFGGLWIRKRIDALADPLRSLAIMFLVMAVLAVLTLPAYGWSFDAIAAALRVFPADAGGYAGFNLVSDAIAAAIMVPATFVAGMTLPVMTYALLRRSDERSIGQVYACNTVGAIAGVLLCVHLLLPAVGLQFAVITGAALQIGVALLLDSSILTTRSPGHWRLAAPGAALLVLAIGTFTHLDPMRMASGVYRRAEARLPADAQVIFLRDGKTATISLARQGSSVTIATNGKPDAAINMGAGAPNADEITMTMAAALPLAVHPAPREVANIGIGSGLTSQVILGSHLVTRLDSIEIEPVMAEAARLGFGRRVTRLFTDPRSHIHFEDAKTWFAASGRAYDVIVSEPSNPWISGVATLFSAEYYRQIKRHLKPGGLLVQWLQIYETDPSVVASILKALSPQFADYVIYSTDDANILIVASADGRVPDPATNLFDQPELAADLRHAGLLTMGDFDIRRIGSKRILDPLVNSFDVPANSDFFPFVDLNAPLMRFMKRDALDLVRLSLLPVPIAEILGEPLERDASDSQTSARYFTRHQFAIDAGKILRAVAQPPALAAVPGAQAPLQELRDTLHECSNADERASWLRALNSLAAITTAYVPARQREPLWQLARQSACLARLESPEREWFEAQSSLASMDRAGLAHHGLALLQTPPASMSGDELIQMLVATVCALQATGQSAVADGLLRGYLPALQNAGRYGLALRLIESAARAAPAPAPAHPVAAS